MVPWMRAPASWVTQARAWAFKSAKSRKVRRGMKLPLTYLTGPTRVAWEIGRNRLRYPDCDICAAEAAGRIPAPSGSSRSDARWDRLKPGPEASRGFQA